MCDFIAFRIINVPVGGERKRELEKERGKKKKLNGSDKNNSLRIVVVVVFIHDFPRMFDYVCTPFFLNGGTWKRVHCNCDKIMTVANVRS